MKGLEGSCAEASPTTTATTNRSRVRQRVQIIAGGLEAERKQNEERPNEIK
jgi:hypothetical protein